MGATIRGREAIEMLAERFPQLYVAPEEGAQDAHRMANGRGIRPEESNLSHFVISEEDELREVETPAGPVEVLFLKDRRDFETFLQIIGHKSQPVPISRTVGAITYRGLADWKKVKDACSAYLASGGDDWSSEFSRLAKETDAFRSEIVIISEGPYSNVPASATPYGEAEWIDVSREIRLNHECAHVVCRRLMPKDVLPVWDEVTADVTGLLCATGGYDATLAARFFGVVPDGYEGGRLEEYLDEDQRERIGEIAAEMNDCLLRVEALCRGCKPEEAFDLLLDMKRNPLICY